jgi:Tfp pilus assembly protein PilV
MPQELRLRVLLYMLLHQPNNRNRGGSLIEVIIVLAIIVGALAAILGLAALSLVASEIGKQTGEAALLAEDTMEALRNYRDGIDWDDDDPADEYDGLEIAPRGTAFHMEQSADAVPRWQLIAGAETVNEFTRQVVFEDICRDASDDIVACPGTVDTDSVEATVTVSWQERGRSHEVELVAYLTNWRQ